MAGTKQYDEERALEGAMLQFWRSGYTAASLDELTAASGLNRSSLYHSFGDKQGLFLRCLDRYTQRYGARYEAALAGESTTDSVAAFFAVTLDRLADPDLPNGCLAAQTAAAAASLPPAIADRAVAAIGLQRARLRAALVRTELAPARIEALAVYLAGVNQALAVLGTGAASSAELQHVADIAVETVAHALG